MYIYICICTSEAQVLLSERECVCVCTGVTGVCVCVCVCVCMRAHGLCTYVPLICTHTWSMEATFSNGGLYRLQRTATRKRLATRCNTLQHAATRLSQSAARVVFQSASNTKKGSKQSVCGCKQLVLVWGFKQYVKHSSLMRLTTQLESTPITAQEWTQHTPNAMNLSIPCFLVLPGSELTITEITEYVYFSRIWSDCELQYKNE